MAWKICQDCQAPNGPRKLYCKECGAAFESTLIAFGHIDGPVKNKNKNQVVVNNTININRNGKITTLNDYDCEIEDTDDNLYIPRTPIHKLASGDDFINLNPTGHFDNLLDREDQINLLVSASQTAIDSNFAIRTHCILYGPPAGGKTSLTTAFINMVGEENCYRIDATTSTQAGIIQDLLERGQNIKFIIIDEIEKCNEDYLRWLLGIMDDRAELRVNNTKVGFVQMPLPALVIATTNNIGKIEKIMGGALASRFTEKVYCPRIRDETIFKAVKQKIDTMSIDKTNYEAWIESAIKYVREEEGTDDIRRMVAVAANGRQRLLNGEYQAILRSTKCK